MPKDKFKPKMQTAKASSTNVHRRTERKTIPETSMMGTKTKTKKPASKPRSSDRIINAAAVGALMGHRPDG